MLEGLEDINWKDLKGTGVSAEKVPELIRQLASDKHSLRKEAFLRLEDTYLANAGDIFEPSAWVIPFLIELLTMDSVQDKGNIASLLARIAPGSGEVMTEWEKRSRAAYVDNFHTLLELIHHPDPEIRVYLFHMLAFPKLFPAHYAPTIAEGLKRRIDLETDTNIRALVIKRLSDHYWNSQDILSHQRHEYIKLFRNLWQSDELYLVPFAGAISLAKVAEEKTPSAAIELFIDAVVNPKKISWPGKGRLSQEYAATEALWRVGNERSIPAYEEILSRVDTPERARRLASRLLYWVFENKRLLTARRDRTVRKEDGSVFFRFSVSKTTRPCPTETLTPDQKQATRVVVENDIVWEHPHNLFEVFGLPTDREEVRKLLD